MQNKLEINDFPEFIKSKSAEEEYPDIGIWQRIPLNKIPKRLKRKDLSNLYEALEGACKEELSEHLWTVLKSVERNRSTEIPDFDEEDHVELFKYFWDMKTVPTPRGVIAFYTRKRSSVDLDISIAIE